MPVGSAGAEAEGMERDAYGVALFGPVGRAPSQLIGARNEPESVRGYPSGQERAQVQGGTNFGQAWR